MLYETWKADYKIKKINNMQDNFEEQIERSSPADSKSLKDNVIRRF